MAKIEIVYLFGMLSGLAMVVLRSAAIGLLKRKGVYERTGSPRRLFFSDVLPLRLLFLQGAHFSLSDRLLVIGLFLSWATFLVALILLLLLLLL